MAKARRTTSWDYKLKFANKTEKKS